MNILHATTDPDLLTRPRAVLDTSPEPNPIS